MEALLGHLLINVIFSSLDNAVVMAGTVPAVFSVGHPTTMILGTAGIQEILQWINKSMNVYTAAFEKTLD